MAGRTSLVYKLWLLSSLVVLAAVLVAPTRKSGSVDVSSRPDCQCDHFALPQAEPTAHLVAGMAADTALEGNALVCEDEEEDRVVVLNEPRASFLIASSFRKWSAHQVLSPRSISYYYPIRS